MKNKLSQATVQVGGLIVGNGPSAGGAGAVGSSGTPSLLKKTVRVTATALTFAQISAATTGEASVTVTGARVGDEASASPKTALAAGLIWSATVTGNDTVTVRIANVTGGALTPAAVDWVVIWRKWS